MITSLVVRTQELGCVLGQQTYWYAPANFSPFPPSMNDPLDQPVGLLILPSDFSLFIEVSQLEQSEFVRMRQSETEVTEGSGAVVWWCALNSYRQVQVNVAVLLQQERFERLDRALAHCHASDMLVYVRIGNLPEVQSVRLDDPIARKSFIHQIPLVTPHECEFAISHFG